MEIHKKKMFVTFFWIIGMLYTGHNLVENYKQFKSYPAMQINKFDGNSELKCQPIKEMTTFSHYFSQTANMLPLATLCVQSRRSIPEYWARFDAKVLRFCLESHRERSVE